MIKLDIPEPSTTEGIIFRQNHIGASDAIIIMNMSPWRTCNELLEEKTGIIPPQAENHYMRRGKALEKEALRRFEQETGYLMSSQGIKHPTIEFMTASLDGLDIDDKAIVEIKCPGKKDHQCALDGEVPKKYKPQLQHQLEVTGFDKIFYFSYVDDSNFKILEVYRDEEYISKLIEAEKQFWNELQKLKETITKYNRMN